MKHHTINLYSVGIGGRAKAVREKARLAATQFLPGHSYELALAGGQGRVYSELLTSLGFECKMVSTNPNTGNRIEGWFKSVE